MPSTFLCRYVDVHISAATQAAYMSYYVPIITWYQSTAPEPRCCWQKHRRCTEKKLKFILSYIKSFEILDKNTPKNISEQSQRQVSH